MTLRQEAMSYGGVKGEGSGTTVSELSEKKRD
jgi:hypothetical protein